MKITIELSDAQVKGLKDYIEETGPATYSKKPGKMEIQSEIQGIVDGNLQTGAVYDHISKYEN